jgi:hypothetical protein
MKHSKLFLLVLLVLASACSVNIDGTPPPPLTATAERVATPSGPTTAEGFPILNPNPGLVLLDFDRVNPYDLYFVLDYDTYLYADYNIHYKPGSVNGELPEFDMSILTEPERMEMFVQAGAGEYGVEQTVTLHRGCYGIKGHFDAAIDDRRHPENHTVNAHVIYADGRTKGLGAKRLLMKTDNYPFFVFYVDTVQTITYQLFYNALFSTAGDNSMVTLRYVWLIDLPEAYC